ncbi:MCP methyltransferase, CheR-type [Pedobacter sp. BAL39]|uniref:chemotaxis protein CheB n=1 Tax=Pedobacter sp. BAL39 TaxID=391596 RepID=UPI0001559CB1|nr:chemotaxis protein CheB [Pedobacter sp. BAL39]EDM37808.1 MCP methyltransferase, CheR-type [Pedobacter sp. BAL39]
MKTSFYVVGIGASAGGLLPLYEFFDHIPSDINAAFVVTTHLDRDRFSILAELLSTHSGLHVARVEQDVEIQPGNIYVLTENTSITTDNGWIKVVTRDQNIINSSVDIFFKSLATDFKEKAIGIVLSGGGEDGLAGALKMNEFGGIVMAQTLITAKAHGMPGAIIDRDHPIEVLSPDKLAEKIVELCGVIVQ